MTIRYKANNTTRMDNASSWTGGIVPGPSDIATWNFTVTSDNTVAYGTSKTWQGIAVTNSGGNVIITDATLVMALGVSGIVLSGIRDLTIYPTVTETNANQAWDVGSRTLTLAGDTTHNQGTVIYKGMGSVVATGSKTFYVGPGATTVDMTGLTHYKGAYANYNVGVGGTIGSTHTLRLSPDSTIVADAFNISATSTGTGNISSTVRVAAKTQLWADNIVVSKSKGTREVTGTLDFLTGGIVTIRNKAGTGAASIVVGQSDSTGSSATGSVNFSGGVNAFSVDASFSTMILGSLNPPSTGSNLSQSAQGIYAVDGAHGVSSNTSVDTALLGYLNSGCDGHVPTALNIAMGVINLGNGNLSINTLRLGDKGSHGTDYDSSTYATGIFNLTGGTLNVNTAFILGDSSYRGGKLPTGYFNGISGTVNCYCDIVTSPTHDDVNNYPTDSTLEDSGYTLNMNGHNIGTLKAPISSLIWSSGILNNCGTINGTGGFTKNSNGNMYLTGTNTWTGPTVLSGGHTYVVGTLSSTSSLTVNTSGTILTASGTIACDATITTSILDVGPNLLTIGSVVLDTGSRYSLNLDSGVLSPCLTSTGNFNCGSAMIYVASMINPVVGAVYTIVTAASITGIFDGLADGFIIGVTVYFGVYRYFRIKYTATTITLTDVVPDNFIQDVIMYN